MTHSQQETNSSQMMDVRDIRVEKIPPISMHTQDTALLLSLDPELVEKACIVLGLSSGRPSFGCVEDRFRLAYGPHGQDVLAARCSPYSRVGNQMLGNWLDQADILVYLVQSLSLGYTSLEFLFSLLPSLPARIRCVVAISDYPAISDHLAAYGREYVVLDNLDQLGGSLFPSSTAASMFPGRKRRSDTLETAPSITPG